MGYSSTWWTMRTTRTMERWLMTRWCDRMQGARGVSRLAILTAPGLQRSSVVTEEDLSSKLQMSDGLYQQLEALQKQSATSGGGADGDDDDESSDPVLKAAMKIEKADDKGYFNSYSHIEIHETMLKDVARTEAYRDAMMANPALFKVRARGGTHCRPRDPPRLAAA